MSDCLSGRDVISAEKNLYIASLHLWPLLESYGIPTDLAVWNILFGLEVSTHGRLLLLESSQSRNTKAQRGCSDVRRISSRDDG